MTFETDQAIMISAWPCVGKTYFTEQNSSSGTEKYVEDIEANARGSPNSIILVSSHAMVRELLRGRGLKYVAVSVHELEDWKTRQLKRLNDDLEHKISHQYLLKKGIAEWGTWKVRKSGEKGAKIILHYGEYLADIGVEEIHKLWKEQWQ
ncbi:hypothetical protein KVR01_001235 [Diaporthe batatas]|uniref:uncharacterized protein n=1 Tax=Diaporthe batatas TaxID=748121 RepID=UPI001D04C87D|nr:uncharacterized protein KVR01_001235 [Diaporthe batatas]KAG8168486.1 hypothetical protein KVR01_001235 [Diaporthe batatas]